MTAANLRNLVILPSVRATASTRTHSAGYRGRGCRKPSQANPALQSIATLRANAAALQLVPSRSLPPSPELASLRRHTEALLGRYLSMSLDAARVPSLMGRELFPGQVSHTRTHGFDDVVHLVHDVAACLNRLSPGQQYLIRRIGIEGYEQPEVAAMRGISLRTIVRRYAEALDRLTALLLERNLLQPNPRLEP